MTAAARTWWPRRARADPAGAPSRTTGPGRVRRERSAPAPMQGAPPRPALADYPVRWSPHARGSRAMSSLAVPGGADATEGPTQACPPPPPNATSRPTRRSPHRRPRRGASDPRSRVCGQWPRSWSPCTTSSWDGSRAASTSSSSSRASSSRRPCWGTSSRAGASRLGGSSPASPRDCCPSPSSSSWRSRRPRSCGCRSRARWRPSRRSSRRRCTTRTGSSPRRPSTISPATTGRARSSTSGRSPSRVSSTWSGWRCSGWPWCWPVARASAPRSRSPWRSCSSPRCSRRCS